MQILNRYTVALLLTEGMIGTRLTPPLADEQEPGRKRMLAI